MCGRQRQYGSLRSLCHGRLGPRRSIIFESAIQADCRLAWLSAEITETTVTVVVNHRRQGALAEGSARARRRAAAGWRPPHATLRDESHGIAQIAVEGENVIRPVQTIGRGRNGVGMAGLVNDLQLFAVILAGDGGGEGHGESARGVERDEAPGDGDCACRGVKFDFLAGADVGRSGSYGLAHVFLEAPFFRLKFVKVGAALEPLQGL